MRKQLIIKIPREATVQEIDAMTKMITENYIPGYPIFMFPNWEYEIVEISEPMLLMSNSKTSKEDFIEAMKNVKLSISND